MKVHLVGPPSPTLSSLAQLFQEHGDVVSHSEMVPADADLYWLCTGHEAIKQLHHGLVILDLRSDPGLEAASWMPFADLCLVHDDDARTSLVDLYGYEPERIFVVPDDQAQALLEYVDQALCDSLPPAAVERRGTTMTDRLSLTDSTTLSFSEQLVVISARLEAAERRADVMLRDYQVRSGLPVVGRLIAWARRNLTSHLREPYLDPVLERQVAMNRELLSLLRDLQHLVAGLAERLARLEEDSEND